MIDALKEKSQLVTWVLLFILGALFLYINLPFVVPLILAGIFAMGLINFTNRIANRVRAPRWLTVFGLVFVGLGAACVPLSLALYRVTVHLTGKQEDLQSSPIVEQLKNLQNQGMGLLKKATEWTGYDLATPAQGMTESVFKKIGGWLLAYSSDVVAQLPGILFNFFIFVLFLYFLLLKAGQIKAFVLRYSVVDEKLTESLIQVAKDSCAVTLFSTFVIGLIQAFLIGVGGLIFGEGDFWLVVTVTFVVSFIPIIGAAPVGFLLAILAFIGGRTGPGIGMAVVATVAGTIDNVLKPFLAGNLGDQKINPVIGFTCVIGAIVMFGISGLLLGPVIMNLAYGAIPLLLKHLKHNGSTFFSNHASTSDGRTDT
ncbi:AI-2E family transporter [Bdellovibrio sp. SKB1291214]|uniref:AI-2E family transporter n=1 Tax=Bdellovibrio sp. SKB1291214 TaxID=1732569 RepID=UPI00223FC5F1|nr:AI-2E family transporter [Bdellovibrio sp. SKB1291214]UYL07917.1 AI-2E family transporter [Bdellovibrio sp. SKB1291214]